MGFIDGISLITVGLKNQEKPNKKISHRQVTMSYHAVSFARFLKEGKLPEILFFSGPACLLVPGAWFFLRGA
jgi:hypothetical protein